MCGRVTSFLLYSLRQTFSSLALVFQRFTRKRCLQVVGPTMRSFAWNRFPIKMC